MRIHKLATYVVSLALLIVGVYLYFSKPAVLWADSPTANVHGYIWTGYDMDGNSIADAGFGWISMNCAEGGPGATNVCSQSLYGVDFDQNSGLLSGHAWGGNGLGWLSFDAGDVAGCPLLDSPAPNKCQGHIDVATGKVSGWFRVLSVPKTGDNGKNGNWNGWIHLSGAFHSSPDATGSKGVTYVQIDPQTSKLVGYAYGSTIASPTFGTEEVGWVAFQTKYSNVTIVTQNQKRGLTLSITDGINTATSGTNATLLTTSPNATNLSTKWTSPQLVKYTACKASATPATANNGVTGWNTTTVVSNLDSNNSYTATAQNITGPQASAQTDYTIECLNSITNAIDTATVSVKGDKNATPTFIFQLSSGFSSVSTGIGVPSTASDTINATIGAPLTLEWRSLNNTEYDQCVATGTWTGTVTSINSGNSYSASDNRTVPATPLLQPYTINCTNTVTGDTTGPLTLKVITSIDPSQHTILMGLSPACVTPGQSFTVTWSDPAGSMSSCHPVQVTPEHPSGWLETLLFSIGNGLLPNGNVPGLSVPTTSSNGIRFKMVCTGTDGLDYPDPNSAIPYYRSPVLRVVQNAADCANQPGQGRPGRIIWNEH